MAIIIREYKACDGYNVDCETALGPRTWHLLSKPDDTQAIVDELENQEIQRNNEENIVMDFAQAKRAKYSELSTWYDTMCNNGVDVGGVVLASTIVDQNRFTSLVTAEHLALTLGVRQLTDISGLADKDGIWHEMPLGTMFNLLLVYGAACSQWSYAYATFLAAINSASTTDELNLINIGD